MYYNPFSDATKVRGGTPRRDYQLDWLRERDSLVFLGVGAKDLSHEISRMNEGPHE